MKDKLPVITITGPRQSGKTTLAKALFPAYLYQNLEFPDVRLFAESDPRAFLSQHDFMIIDEIQHVPELFSYIQGFVDQEPNKKGRYILTGSQNFLLLDRISQSLAGRTALFELFPLSYEELKNYRENLENVETLMYQGGYPRIWQEGFSAVEWLPLYIQTYLERDVRQILNVQDLSKFQRFIRLCAARTGQLINLSGLGNEAGVDHKTISRWLSILEASFLIFIVRPFYQNFNKRLVKSPKLFFTDTGLLCNLLNIKNPEQLDYHYLKGNIFENWIIAEIHKKIKNESLSSDLYYWRNNKGLEIDCLLESAGRLTAIEIKSGKTFQSGFLDNLKKFSDFAGLKPEDNYLIFGGNQKMMRDGIQVLPWHAFGKSLSM